MAMDALNGISASYQTVSMGEQAAPVNVAGPEQLTSIADSMAAGSRNAQIQTKGGQPSNEEIQSAVNSANKRAQFGHASAQFAYHEDSHSISIKIIDKDTNEVIREIPSEETLEMISRMWDLAGIMIDEKR